LAAYWYRHPQGLLIRRWDGECVVFDEASGQTHHLGPLPSVLLDLLGDRPVAEERLLASAATALREAGDEEFCAIARDALGGLDARRLIGQSEGDGEAGA